jgi:hypothetical protein
MSEKAVVGFDSVILGPLQWERCELLISVSCLADLWSFFISVSPSFQVRIHYFYWHSYESYYNLAQNVNMDAFTPAQTTELVSRIGAKKARMRVDKMFINSFMGGALISFGCALALSTNTAPWFQTNAPGLIRTIGAMVFPVGLISKLARSRSFNFLEYLQ